MQQIKIIHEPTAEEPFVVIDKPAGLPSAPLSAADYDNALAQCASCFPSVLSVRGKKEIEHGLLHRLDTMTRGLLLISASQDWYDSILEQQSSGAFKKTYAADCRFLPDNPHILGGFPPLSKTMSAFRYEPGETIPVRSYFRNFGKKSREVRPVTADSGRAALKKCASGKLYETEISVMKKSSRTLSVRCTIPAGYRHQVRCHLAWLGIPVEGDMIYNALCRQFPVTEQFGTEQQADCNMRFSAEKLSFIHPCTGRRLTFSLGE